MIHESTYSTGLLFVGCGVSGGEEGARYGPSMMPGGNPKSWPYIKPIFQVSRSAVNNYIIELSINLSRCLISSFLITFSIRRFVPNLELNHVVTGLVREVLDIMSKWSIMESNMEICN